MTAASEPLSAYDNVAAVALCARADAPVMHVVATCDSTMDLAHALAVAGGAHGAVVVAEAQQAGRGRSGKAWRSERGAGVWVSVLLRQPADSPPGVLSLRVGLALATALDRHTKRPIQLKWPNDLVVHGAKLAGVLTEARWRGPALEWIVVGVGVNLRVPDDEQQTAALSSGVRASDVLVDIVRAVLHAGVQPGEMSATELAAYAARDYAAGRQAVAPVVGLVRGITPAGGLVVETAAGERIAVSGSLVFSSSGTE